VPQPKEMRRDNHLDYLEIVPSEFKLDSVLNRECIIVSMAGKRYLPKLLFDDVAPEPKDDPMFGRRRRLGRLERVELVAGDYFKCESMPHSDMDESYELVVEPVGGHYNDTRPTSSGQEQTFNGRIVARSSWGLLRGLETLSQLIFNIEPSSGRFGIGLVSIKDAPRFKHRGFMLDTARHYISLERIFEILDAMAADKLNVFHWHLVDDQSFPFQSAVFPQLSKLNSFRPELIYTPKDVQLVIMYAALRGIRVLPELDTPGHTYALRHIPNLLTECFDTKTGQPNGDFGPVDPTQPSAYAAVNKLLHEFAQVFADSHFHAGGDEVEFDCWRSNERVNNWMKANNMSDNYEALTNYYMRQLHKLIGTQHNKTMIVWQEVFDLGANLPKDVIVHVWKDINNKPGYMEELAGVVKAGYPALLSSCWYLNYIDYGQDWIKFYQCDPRADPVGVDTQHLVLGGEICMWTEYVDDTNVVSRTWPRASAAAERLWSPISSNDPKEFVSRLEQHRCRLIRRGIQVEPVVGPGYC
jgi:hexosaminidase